MPHMTIIDREELMALIVAYGDARENGRGAADAYSDIDGVLDNSAAQSIGSVCAVYVDVNGSRRQHDLNAALTDAQAGRFDVLLVRSMNELMGAPRLLQIVERFNAASVTVRSLAEHFDSTSPLAAFGMVFADADSTMRKQRSRRGIEQAAPARTLTVSTPPSRSGRPGGRSAGALRRGLRRARPMARRAADRRRRRAPLRLRRDRWRAVSALRHPTGRC